MTREEFIKSAEEYGYKAEDIQGLLQFHDDMEKDGANLPYEMIVLIEQPEY